MARCRGVLLLMIDEVSFSIEIDAALSFHQGVGGSIPALVDVSLNKTRDPELLRVAVATLYECNMIVSLFG